MQAIVMIDECKDILQAVFLLPRELKKAFLCRGDNTIVPQQALLSLIYFTVSRRRTDHPT